MPLPIAQRFSSLSSTSSSSSSVGPSRSSVSTNNTHHHHHPRPPSSNLSRLSIQPGEDPFAPVHQPSPVSEHFDDEQQLDGAGEEALGGEAWRISEESALSAGESEGRAVRGQDGRVSGIDGKQHKGGQVKAAAPKRRPSFLRTLLRRSSSLSFSRPSSPSPSTSLSTSQISHPIPSASHPPPRVQPLRSSASLVSLNTAKQRRRSWMADEGQGMGTRSLGAAAGRAVRRGGEGEPKRERERLSANPNRRSQVGLALTTDSAFDASLPTPSRTRHVVPNNARLSIYSTTTTTTTLYSSAGSEIGGRQRVRSTATAGSGLGSYHERDGEQDSHGEEEEEYDPTQEDGEATSLYRVGPPSSAEIPPPLPPLPGTSTTSNSQHRTSGSSSSARTTRPIAKQPSSRSLAASTTSSYAPLPPGLAPSPPSSIPPPPPPRPPRSTARPHPPSHTTAPPLPSPSPSLITKKSATPLASMYLIAGLPPSPSSWSLADHSDLGVGGGVGNELNALPRFWRAEVLGVSLTGDGEEGWEGARMSKGESERVKGKCVKLAFPRDLQVLASMTQPESRMSHFSFSVTAPPSAPSTSAQGGSAADAWDSTLRSSSTSASQFKQDDDKREKIYHTTTLLIYSLATPSQSSSIRSSLSSPPSSTSGGRAVKKAVKAASAGRKLGDRLRRQMESPLGAVVDEGGRWAGGARSDTEGETEGFVTESEWGDFSGQGGAAAQETMAHLAPNTPFWLPYALVLVSTAPVYNLLTDILRISWARYHQDVASHSLQMQRVLHFPLPSTEGAVIKLPVSVSNKQETFFVTTMPSKETVDIAMWPVFKALHADHLLTIAEIALAPLGRVLFVSRHSIMLSLAISTFSHILTRRGWSGVSHSSVHIRDLKIYVEDPGPWLIGISTLSRSLALSELAPEVLVVDLDTNSVECARVAPGALSTGVARERSRKRLEMAIGSVGGQFGVPSEVTEAFPGGRFRPFSDVEVGGVPKDAERLRPSPSWNWDQARLIKEFDAILASKPRTGLARFLPGKKSRRVAELDPSAKHVQSIVRKHAATFVDRRDLLEGKINKLNGKLASLMAESNEWSKSFDIFKEFSDKLTKESVDLKTRLEKERREARRLTGQMNVEKERQARLEASLTATEQAREQALQELSNVQLVRANLEQQRSLLMSEMQIILAADESSPLYESVYARLESLSQGSSRPSSSLSRRSSSRLGRPSFAGDDYRGLDPLDEDDEEMLHTQSTAPQELGEEERLEAMKQAVQETLHSIQSRLSIVLQNAGQLEITREPRRRDSATVQLDPRDGRRSSLLPPPSSSSRLPDTPPLSQTTLSSHVDIDADDSFSTAHEGSSYIREPRRFEPKPFQLTPPISPELSFAGPAPFVTTERGGGRRAHHRNNDSIASSRTTSSHSQSTPSTATPQRSFTPASNRTRSSSIDMIHSNSFGQLDGGRFGTPSRSSEYGDWDDGQSFASASEGLGHSRSGSEAVSLGSPGDSEEEMEELDRTERIRREASPQPKTEGARMETEKQQSHHSHQRAPSSAGASSPVELFTRAVSPNGGRRRDGSIDMGRRLAPERFAPWRAGGAPVKVERPIGSATFKPTRRL